MAVYRVITTGPKAFILHTEDEERAALIVQMLGEHIPYVDFDFEETQEFFDLPDAFSGIADCANSVGFQMALERGLAANAERAAAHA